MLPPQPELSAQAEVSAKLRQHHPFFLEASAPTPRRRPLTASLPPGPQGGPGGAYPTPHTTPCPLQAPRAPPPAPPDGRARACAAAAFWDADCAVGSGEWAEPPHYP